MQTEIDQKIYTSRIRREYGAIAATTAKKIIIKNIGKSLNNKNNNQNGTRKTGMQQTKPWCVYGITGIGSTERCWTSKLSLNAKFSFVFWFSNWMNLDWQHKFGSGLSVSCNSLNGVDVTAFWYADDSISYCFFSSVLFRPLLFDSSHCCQSTAHFGFHWHKRRIFKSIFISTCVFTGLG